MWARNLLFWGVCIAGLGAFVASVSTTDPEKHPAAGFDWDSLRPTVERVDAAFQKVWHDQQLVAAPRAPQLTVARRLSLALTGTIPSLEEIRRFESWPEESRTQRWLAEILADRRSADFVAERLARATVGVEDGPFLLYRRRRFVSWLADELAANRPYDEIVRHLIADAGLWTDTPATNFITVTIQPDQETGPDANQLAARVSRAFLGIRMDCAECHDHPFEPWKQRDFQSLAAFFGQTKNSLRGIRDVRGEYRVENRGTGEMELIECAVPYEDRLLPADGTARRRLAAWVTHADNRPFAREAVNRAWALLFGRPLVEPIDNLKPEGGFPPALEILADDFVSHRFDWRRLVEVIASTEVFALDSRLDDASQDGASPEGGAQSAGASAREAAWAVFPLTRLRPEQVVGSLLQAASLATIDSSSHIVVRLAREIGQRDFVKRYGDSGAEEFDAHGGTIPQRLLMMNGHIVHDKTKDSLLANASARIATLAPDDDAAVETAMLAVLTRRADDVERRHFAQRLAGSSGKQRTELLSDLYWTLVNSTEFSWNH